MTTQPREQPAPCQVCRTDTWAVSAVCDGCTRARLAAAIRDDGVREALNVLRPSWRVRLSQQERVAAATVVLLESCKRQAQVLP